MKISDAADTAMQPMRPKDAYKSMKTDEDLDERREVISPQDKAAKVCPRGSDADD